MNNYELLKKMSFERLGGSKEELACANLLLDELQTVGIKGELESFQVDYSEVQEVSFEVLEPYYKKYHVTAYKMSGNTEINGLEAPFLYVENGLDVNLKEAKDKIVLLNGAVGYKTYKKLVEAKALGFVALSGSIYDREDETDLEERQLRERHYKNGKIPGVSMRAKDVEELILQKASKVRLKLTQNESTKDSHNVIATIDGSTFSDEIICFTAHYDSVRFSKGSYDNATGSVIIMDLLKYFIKNKPLRTLKFIWCGSEEMGLLGSKAYTKKHEDELKNYLLCINVDMAGNTIGYEQAVSTAEIALVNYIDYLGKEIGFPIISKQGVYPSDSTPFANASVPAVSFARLCDRNGAQIHSRKDNIKHLDEETLNKTSQFVLEFARRMVFSYVVPVSKEIPENMRKELDIYLGVKED